MRRAEIACAAALLIVAGVVAREALRLDIGWGDAGPKGGFFPFWLAVILGSSSLSILARAVFTSKLQRTEEPFLTRERFGLVLIVLVPIALAVPLIEIIGFYLTAFLYLSFYIRWTGGKPWWVTGTISFLCPFAIYWVFEKWFFIPLPKGLLQLHLPF
jgi:putative tricarboxylic transport membrane protein